MCKEFSRKNEHITSHKLEEFVKSLDVEDHIKDELNTNLDVYKYIGNAKLF